MFKRANILVISIVLVQFVCVTSVAWWYAGWQRQAWDAALTRQLVEAAGQLVSEGADQLRTALPDTPSRDLQRDRPILETFLAHTLAPAGWELGLIDGDGRRIVGNLSALPESPEQWRFEADGQVNGLINQLEWRPQDTHSGQLLAQGGYTIAAQRVPQTPYALVAYRRTGPIAHGYSTLSTSLGKVGAAMVVLTVLLMGLSTLRIVKRYETKVAARDKTLQDKVLHRTAALVQTRDAVVFGLAKLAESRDQETGAHILRMQKLSCLLAEHLRHSEPEIDVAWVERIRRAAALHDIGKVGVADAILLKPGPLTPSERRIMQTHTTIGAECLEAIGERLGNNDFLAMAHEIALAHHEWWNGGGYPRGLKGTEIPLAARIVAVADVYDAACSARVYKEAKSHARVRALILGARGTQFDPRVVDAFLALERQFAQVLATEHPPTTINGTPPRTGEPAIPTAASGCFAARTGE